MIFNASLILVFIMLVVSSVQGIPILYPLTAGLALFFLISMKEGFKPADIAGMVWCGIRKPSKIYEITLLVGASASLWMACGTVPFFIHYGLTLIAPELFVVSVFLITCLLALAIGSAFGTAGIIGVVFMVMARAGGVDPNLAAGAIITAAYFCERSTPLSSCANLVAILTGTDLYGYLRRLFTGTWIPFAATVALYLLFSLKNPLHGNFSSVSGALEALFNLSPLVTAPALVVAACVLFKADVRLTLLLSILTAAATGILLQAETPAAMLRIMLTGYHLDSHDPLAASLQSGGMAAMVQPILVIAVPPPIRAFLKEPGCWSILNV